jgi:hypothetical protein
LDLCFYEGNSVTFSASGVKYVLYNVCSSKNLRRLTFGKSTVSLTGHYMPGQPSLIEETFNMLEDQDPMDQEYLDGFGMHHFGIGPTDAEDKNLRDEESSELEKTEKYALNINGPPINHALTLFFLQRPLITGSHKFHD